MTQRRAMLVEIRDLLREVLIELRTQRAAPVRPVRRRALPPATPEAIERVRRRLHRTGISSS